MIDVGCHERYCILIDLNTPNSKGEKNRKNPEQKE
jgi:hypothetical protein